MKTKYTNYPSNISSNEQSDSTANKPGLVARDASNDETEDVCETKVVNFYGADKNEVDKGENNVGLDRIECGTDQIVYDEPGTMMELPCYAPEVCVETVIGFEEPMIEKDCENDIEASPIIEIQPVTMEIEAGDDNIEPHPPPEVNVTEADIFGNTDDESQTEPQDG